MITAIIGFGRFGKLLKSILESDHEVLSFDKGDPLEKLRSCETLFICVPIREFETTLQNITAYVQPGTTVVDTCSVKVYPAECMQRLLPQHSDCIATHPLFGPDSYREEHSNRLMMHPLRNQFQQYAYWQQFFSDKGLEIIEMTPDEHDRFAARSQGITHLLGRVLQHIKIEPTPIDTLGFERLLGIMNQTCNDSWELFYDLQRYNPYTQPLIKEITSALEQLARAHF